MPAENEKRGQQELDLYESKRVLCIYKDWRSFQQVEHL